MIIIISRCVNSYVRDIIRANDDMSYHATQCCGIIVLPSLFYVF